VRIDPWSSAQLAADRQYSVVVDAGTGTVTAVVSELNLQGGDGAMMYEGFAATP
jgi:pantothenate kinase type III